MTTLTEGSKAPVFPMPTDSGGSASTESLSGKAVVLYFYPKADTPGCTNEAKDFTALMSEFESLNAVVIGVSKDPVRKLEKFKAKYDLAVTLASDEQSGVCEAFGTWVEKSMYGKTYWGIQRATFLIDGKGIIRRIWPKVSVKGHAADVLEAVKRSD